MKRREFLSDVITVGGAWACTGALTVGVPLRASQALTPKDTGRRFRLNYAPHIGTFHEHAGPDPIDQIRFIADRGFAALEDNGLKQRPRAMQERMGRELDRWGMRMGLFTGTVDFGHPTFASGRSEFRRQVLRDIRVAIDVSRRTGAGSCTVVPGLFDRRLPIGDQTAHCVDLLRRCADLCERAGLVMLLEPLDDRAGHPKLFLQTVPQARRICEAVNSPACKILFDASHQAITAGSLLREINAAWNQIAYFQVGDNPGRKEPGTGSVNYHAIFRHIDRRGFTGLLGMEHGNSRPGKAGEQAVIDAYLAHDRSLA